MVRCHFTFLFRYLSNNLFNGSLPSFTDLREGISIYLACNNISGLVPWADIVKVNPEAFDVSQNELHGELTLLRDMTKLVDLSLDSNHLTGQLPQEWLMLQSLHVLDLSSNKLSGFLPTSFESLTLMNSQRNDDVRFLEFYFVHYGFPGSDYEVNITTEVKLNNNKGIFYSYNQNGTNLMKYIDVSNNQLTGETQEEIGALKARSDKHLSVKGLKILNMSYNHFSGKIRKSLALISELDSLYLSNNDLSREIPPELSSLSMLGDLCSSHSNLTGKIPDEPHFGTYPASSFADNPVRSRCFAVFDRIIYSTHFFILMVLARMKVLS